MSTKSITRRLCSGFYDLAWLNVSAGIENLPDPAASEGDGSFKSLREGLGRSLPAEADRLMSALSADDREAVTAATEQLLAMREKVAETTEKLSGCRKRAEILTRALERRRAAGESVVPDVDTEEEVRRLLGKMFSSEDPVITNLRIQYMVSVFPARMTRKKLYDLISGYLSIYVKQDSAGLESFLYRLRGAAVLSEQKDTVTEAAEGILDAADALLRAETDTQETDTLAALTALTAELKVTEGYLESVERCINPLAAIGILSGLSFDITENSTVHDDLFPAVRLQIRQASGESVDASELSKRMASAYDAMEQWFEPLSVLVDKETGRLQEAIDDMDDESAVSFIPVMKAARLLSTSAFASLSEDSSHTVEPEEVETAKKKLLEAVDKAFEDKPKALTRELTASILSELPVWFENRTEVMNYMLQSLSGCRTDGERRYAVLALRKLFEAL